MLQGELLIISVSLLGFPVQHYVLLMLVLVIVLCNVGKMNPIKFN